MLRRSVATVFLAFSLCIGTLAWSGFLALRTVLDAERSEAVAEALYEDEAVRARLAANLAGALGAAAPDGAPFSQDQLNDGAQSALDSPAVEALMVDAFVRTHQAFLGEGEAPASLDAGALGAASRDALVTQDPALDTVLPPSPQLTVLLPTERVPDAGWLVDLLERAVPLLALVAAGGALFALLATSDRPTVLRRSGFWAVGLATIVLAFAFGVPWLADRFAPEQSEVVAALVGALASSTKGPALALAATGVLGIVVAFIWNRRPDRVAARGVTYNPSIQPATMPGQPPVQTRPRRGGRSSMRAMPNSRRGANDS